VSGMSKVGTKFKIGDKVKYTSGTWGDDNENPLWNGVCGQISGVVDNIEIFDGGLPFGVRWSNGEHNSYRYVDLEYLVGDWDK